MKEKNPFNLDVVSVRLVRKELEDLVYYEKWRLSLYRMKIREAAASFMQF